MLIELKWSSLSLSLPLVIRQMPSDKAYFYAWKIISGRKWARAVVTVAHTDSFPKHLFHRSLVKFLRLRKYYRQLDKRSGIELNISNQKKKKKKQQR